MQAISWKEALSQGKTMRGTSLQSCYYRTRIGTLKSFSRSAAPSVHFWPCLQQWATGANISCSQFSTNKQSLVQEDISFYYDIWFRVEVEGEIAKGALLASEGRIRSLREALREIRPPGLVIRRNRARCCLPPWLPKNAPQDKTLLAHSSTMSDSLHLDLLSLYE